MRAEKKPDSSFVANGLAEGRKWIIEKQCIGLSEPDAALTTFDFRRVEVILSVPVRFIDIDCFEHTHLLFGFHSGASADFPAAVRAALHHWRCLGKLIWPCQIERRRLRSSPASFGVNR